MNKYALLAGFLCSLIAPTSVGANDEDIIILSLEVSSDGERVSAPRVALKPGTDASITQGLDEEGFDEELVLKIVFHSIHVSEEGAEMLIDTDFGVGEPEHLGASHVTMPWGEAYPMSFKVAEDAPQIDFSVTPTRGKRSDFLLGRK